MRLAHKSSKTRPCYWVWNGFLDSCSSWSGWELVHSRHPPPPPAFHQVSPESLPVPIYTPRGWERQALEGQILKPLQEQNRRTPNRAPTLVLTFLSPGQHNFLVLHKWQRLWGKFHTPLHTDERNVQDVIFWASATNWEVLPCVECAMPWMRSTIVRNPSLSPRKRRNQTGTKKPDQ